MFVSKTRTIASIGVAPLIATFIAVFLGAAAPASAAVPGSSPFLRPDPTMTVQGRAATLADIINNAPVTTTARRGDGVIRITMRICGSSVGWQNVAAANNIPGPNYPVDLGQTLQVQCRADYYGPRTASGPQEKKAETPAPPAKPAAAPAPAAVTGDWIHPLASGVKVRSSGGCVGAARSGHTHQGLDLVASSGTPIRAIHGGTIVANSWQSSAGYYVAIDHGNGYQSVYMHLVKPGLAKGTKVSIGQTIGYVGATGDASGPHLHFEIHNGLWKNRLNPAPWMRARGVDLGC